MVSKGWQARETRSSSDLTSCDRDGSASNCRRTSSSFDSLSPLRTADLARCRVRAVGSLPARMGRPLNPFTPVTSSRSGQHEHGCEGIDYVFDDLAPDMEQV